GFGGLNTPAMVNNYFLGQNGTAWSLYTQLQFKPIEVLEIDIGGRYSKESKNLPFVFDGGGLSEGIIPGSTILGPAQRVTDLAVTSKSWDDFSPEATISYRPSRNNTFFMSYKHGFLSGGFNSSSVNFAVPDLDLSYGPETIQGTELGWKSRML